MRIKFFGVWAAFNESMDNTYFLIEDWEKKLQVDCGWGLNLWQLVKRWEIHFNDIFITHCHSDHLLGFFHLHRAIWNIISKLNVYCSKNVENNVRQISKLITGKAKNEMFNNWIINFINNDNLEKQNIWDFEIEPINLNSKKMIQFGFILKYNWIKIVFFWDEAVWVLERDDLDKMKQADYLICEALTIEKNDTKNWWKINLEKMSHISAKTAWKIANKLNVKNLILVHTHEFVWKNRQQLLKEDAKTEFSWNIIVPNQWDEIFLK